MKKQQFILVGSGIVLLVLLYFFGNTVPPKKETQSAVAVAQAGQQAPTQKIAFNTILQAAKQKLTPSQQEYTTRLESSVVRGDVKAQQIKVYQQLAAFWKDSAHYFEPYAWYIASAAKLENSEKSLTFAARQFLNALQGTNTPQVKTWMADQAKELFEKALELNPANDSSRIGLGSCYIFGSSAESPQEMMQGIQQILAVANRDSTNMYAQLMLGVGGVVSGQLDKAQARLTKVVEHEPANLEGLLMLAEVYERKGEKAAAAKWYEQAGKYITDEGMKEELNNKIKTLK
ncbi:MAG TPA: tetratricopeptide repeat protein [Chitinophagaceae bacterium]|nr:tetratricopeptide repeat protein [Chitinophagaceae bacterium]